MRSPLFILSTYTIRDFFEKLSKSGLMLLYPVVSVIKLKRDIEAIASTVHDEP